jgi:hypothetical protein
MCSVILVQGEGVWVVARCCDPEYYRAFNPDWSIARVSDSRKSINREK